VQVHDFPAPPGARDVLFVGNSFTFSNSMPRMVARLAQADRGGAPLHVVAIVRGGWRLSESATDARVDRQLRKHRWSTVVLQEQSQIGALATEDVYVETAPYAIALARKARSAGATPLLFETWGYTLGDVDTRGSGDSFWAMQQRLLGNYTYLGDELGAPVAYVGEAFARAVRRRPDVALWAEDGRHPSLAGSYLAACVLYAKLTGRDPLGNPYIAGLPSAFARELQAVAVD